VSILSEMQYPHWLMVAGAVLVVVDLSVWYSARTGTPSPIMNLGDDGEWEIRSAASRSN
jgi:hypothetical protein